MAGPVIEICVDTLAGAQAADRGGADRIEFCSALSEGGLTPGLGIVEVALETVATPLHIMVRPRAGDFVYSRAELVSMRRDIDRFKDAGAHGIVLGILTPTRDVDVERTRELVQRASPMPVTFHRAFDTCCDLERSLEDVIATGAKMLMTSGGAFSLAEGATKVARLVQLARDRIAIIASAGVTVETAAGLWRATRSAAIHASLRRSTMRETIDDFDALPGISGPAPSGPSEEDVRALIGALRAEGGLSTNPLL